MAMKMEIWKKKKKTCCHKLIKAKENEDNDDKNFEFNDVKFNLLTFSIEYKLMFTLIINLY